MKINFGDYSYIDVNNSNKNTYFYNANNPNHQEISEYTFNKQHFNNLLSTKNFDEAYNYASKYTINDPDKDAQFHYKLWMMKMEGNKEKALYSSVGVEDRDKLDFYESVFSGFNLNNLKSNVNNETTNPYAKTYMDYLSNIGGKNATDLSITFAPKTRTLFGIDWIAKDNTNNIDNYYSILGMKESDLTAKGIKVIQNKDGSTSVRFSKSNPLASKLLYSVPEYQRSNYKSGYGFSGTDIIFGNGWINTTIKGYDTENKETSYDTTHEVEEADSFLDMIGNIVKGTTNIGGGNVPGIPFVGFANNIPRRLVDGKNMTIPDTDNYYLTNIRNLINDAKSVKDTYDINRENTYKVTTSEITGSLIPNFYSLKQQLDYNIIDEGQFYDRVNKAKSYLIENTLSHLGKSDFEIYTDIHDEDLYVDDNYEYKEDYDATQRLVKPEQRDYILHLINSANPNDIDINGKISGNKIGAEITIKGKIDEKTGMIKYRDKKIFIPGLLTEEIEKQIGGDSYLQAVKQFNDMQEYGYGYKLYNDEEIKYNGDGTFSYGGQNIDFQKAKMLINKDIIINTTKIGLKNRVANNNYQLIDRDYFAQQAMLIAYNSGNELYKDVPYATLDGTSLDLQTIFAMKGIGNAIQPEYAKNINNSLYNKLTEVYDIYTEIMKELNYFAE